MQKLSESELSIMMKIWDENKPLYLEEIIELLKEYNWAESTVRNFLSRIIDKGYLKTEKDGRKNVYIPLVSQDYINKKSKGIIEELYDNSVKKLFLTSFLMSLVILLLLIHRKIRGTKFSSKVYYIIWIIIAIRLVLPFDISNLFYPFAF